MNRDNTISTAVNPVPGSVEFSAGLIFILLCAGFGFGELSFLKIPIHVFPLLITLVFFRYYLRVEMAGSPEFYFRMTFTLLGYLAVLFTLFDYPGVEVLLIASTVSMIAGVFYFYHKVSTRYFALLSYLYFQGSSMLYSFLA